MPIDERTCAVCFGPMGKTPGDICCRDEDQYLLICAKGILREFDDRSATIEDLVEHLYEKLDEYLTSKGTSITDFEENGVMAEIERRVLRWINKGLLPVKSVQGIGFCQQCGVPIMAGRQLCARCGDTQSSRRVIGSGQANPPVVKPRGMHIKPS